MKVSFELSQRDLRYFRERLARVRSGKKSGDEKTIIQLAEDLLTEAAAAEPPEFVTKRLRKLEQLIEMLGDEDWRLQGRDRARIVDAPAYFVDPDDLIPDRVPGIGYVDDAIMIELVAQELKHDIQAYEDFCEFRKRGPKAADQGRLEARRTGLQARMRRRRRRQREVQRSRSNTKRSPVRLW